MGTPSPAWACSMGEGAGSPVDEDNPRSVRLSPGTRSIDLGADRNIPSKDYFRTTADNVYRVRILRTVEPDDLRWQRRGSIGQVEQYWGKKPDELGPYLFTKKKNIDPFVEACGYFYQPPAEGDVVYLMDMTGSDKGVVLDGEVSEPELVEVFGTATEGEGRNRFKEWRLAMGQQLSWWHIGPSIVLTGAGFFLVRLMVRWAKQPDNPTNQPLT